MTLRRLIKGFRTFRTSYFEGKNTYKSLVKKGQNPTALVIACSDSRNDPALLTQSEPGDIFVVRNVAAIVPPYQPDDNYHGTSAAIEFAIKGLKIKNIIVLGHALCGGVQTLAEQAGKSDKSFEFLSQWITIGAPARDMVNRILPDAPTELKHKAMEQALILTSLNNLMTFPWIKQGVQSGDITVHGWYFDMIEGQLLSYNFAAGEFREIKHKGEGCSHKPQQDNKKCCDSWSLEQLVKRYA